MDAVQGELELGKQHHFRLNQFLRKKFKKNPVPTEKQCYVLVGRSPAMMMLGKEMNKDDLSESNSIAGRRRSNARISPAAFHEMPEENIYYKQMEKKIECFQSGFLWSVSVFELNHLRTNIGYSTPNHSYAGAARAVPSVLLNVKQTV